MQTTAENFVILVCVVLTQMQQCDERTNRHENRQTVGRLYSS